MSAQVMDRETREVVDHPGEALPAWPVLMLLWGFPAFWLLGATVITGLLLTIVMLSYLAYLSATRFVPGAYAYVAFAIWVIPCGLMIDSGSRMAGFAYRYSILMIVATAFIYTISAGSRLSRRRIINGLTFVWFFTICGGLLGLLFPHVRLSTPVGLLMPSSLTKNEYVHDLFFPPFAEIQKPFGAPSDLLRPSAPFPYANSWGVAIVLLTPVAVACFLQTKSKALRAAIIIGLIAMIPPAMATSNRAMFAGLGLAAVYVVIRMAVRNRAAPVLTIGILGLIGGLVLVGNGLLTQIQERQSYGSSSETRFSLYRETIQRTWESPILGFGAPRPSYDNIVSVGTQGYFWTLMFSFGFVGLALFLTFLWGTTARTWRATGDIDLVLHSVLIVTCLIIFVYGLDVMQLLTVMLISAMLLRRRYGLDTANVGD